jgi:hypothetical protein
MDVRVRCCSLTKNAADGSLIGETVVKNYLESKEYKLSIDGKLTMGYLTHRGRSMETMPGTIGNTATLKKVVGRDDAGLCVADGVPTFTHYVKEFYIENVPGEGPWLCALVHILDEDGFDDIAAANIKRLKALIRSGIKLTCSLVVVAYWDSQSSGVDICRQIKNIKSLDWTVNPSFGPLARITEVYDDKPDTSNYSDDVYDELVREFSEIEKDDKFVRTQPKNGELKVKEFSDLNSFGLGDAAKTSKVDGVFTKLKVKEFSSVGVIEILPDEVEVSVAPTSGVKEKTFSVTSVKERVKEAKLSPRERFRRLILDYKQVVKASGGISKIDEPTLKVMKSLFASDVLSIMQVVTPMVLEGKNLVTLLNAGALGVEVRKASQAMFIPYKQALAEAEKQGYVSKNKYQAIQTAYATFIKSLQNFVFGSENSEAEINNEEIEEEEGK